jgi:hypothetical protein
MKVRMGSESIRQVAVFSVGEGGGALPFATSAPALTGGVEAWQKLGERATLGAIGSAAQFAAGDRAVWSGPQDLSATIYGAWTKEALLVGVNVTDDTVIGAPAGSDPWNSDAVEVFVDGRGAAFQYQKEPSEGVYQIGVSPGEQGAAPVVKVLSRSPLQGLETSALHTPSGYFVSLRIPLSRVNFSAGDWDGGRPIKLSVLLNDKDQAQSAARENIFGWSFSPGGANHSDTSGWRTLLLAH